MKEFKSKGISLENMVGADPMKEKKTAGTLRWRATRRWPLICRTTDRRLGTGSSPLNWRTSTTSCMEGRRSPGTFRQRILR